MRISVCMATYNGQKFIYEQIASIRAQLNKDDEIIVIDDGSTDETVAIINAFGDERITVYLNNINKGVNFSFARAISLAKNDIIFMSDQDDIWIEGRVKLMTTALISSKAFVVSSNSEFINAIGKRIAFQIPKLKADDSTKYFKNIIAIFQGKANYYGCAMAFKKKIVRFILPIPSFVESHDLWIALASNLIRSNIHLEKETLQRRIHGNNASILKRGFLSKLWSRVIFIFSIIVLYFRLFKFK